MSFQIPDLSRVPPHNFEIEMALLAALLASNRMHDRVSHIVKPEHFADARHGRIYAAIDALIQKGQQANAATLKNYFENDGELSSVGGIDYLARLQASAVTIINVADYARRLFDLWQRREIIDTAMRLVESAQNFDLEADTSHIIETAERDLYRIGAEGVSDTGVVTLQEAAAEMLRQYKLTHERGGMPGIATGFVKLDAVLGGFEPGNLYVVAARPSMGKTAFVTSSLMRLAPLGTKTLFFQLEMTASQIARRMAASMAGLDIAEIKSARLDSAPWRALLAAEETIRDWPIQIVDRPGLSASQIRSRARRERLRGKCDLIVVDHLTLMAQPIDAKGMNPAYAVGQNSGALKRLAKELNVPVVVLSQLSRANETREEKRPQLSDLRWSGDIEQDADAVMFIHRESYYLKRAEPLRKPTETTEAFFKRQEDWRAAVDQHEGKAEIIIAKQRDGAICTVQLDFEEAVARFSDPIEKRDASPQLLLS